MPRSRGARTRAPTASSGRWGEPRRFDFAAAAPLGPRARARHPRLRAGREDRRRAVHRAQGRGRAAGSAPCSNFMLDSHVGEHGYTEVWPPVLANARVALRHRTASRNSKRTCSRRPTGSTSSRPAEVPLTNLHRDEILTAEELPIRYTAAHAVLPVGGRGGRPRHARHDPPARVRQGRDRDVHAARGVGGGARDAHRPCRRGAPTSALQRSARRGEGRRDRRRRSRGAAGRVPRRSRIPGPWIPRPA